MILNAIVLRVVCPVLYWLMCRPACATLSTMSSASNWMNLIVFVKSPGSLKLHDGSKYTISEMPINMYTWQLNLTIKSLQKTDFGTYTCTSVNALGKQDARIRLRGKCLHSLRFKCDQLYCFMHILFHLLPFAIYFIFIVFNFLFCISYLCWCGNRIKYAGKIDEFTFFKQIYLKVVLCLWENLAFLTCLFYKPQWDFFKIV